ncbi:hypothetical protein T484DRAFT_1879654 [Baffinella frigidus]|nr:hypothetical protein T484DRAFT_1879654 [Cryptophyta sp. CCMP2293]
MHIESGTGQAAEVAAVHIGSGTGQAAEVAATLREWVAKGALRRNSQITVEVVYCTYQPGTEKKPREGVTLSLKRDPDNDKYMRYRDEVATLMHEAFPFATVRFNAAKGVPPAKPPTDWRHELLIFSKLQSKKWPNLARLQRLLESALGAQRVTLAMTFLGGDSEGNFPRGSAPEHALPGLHVEVYAVKGEEIVATPRIQGRIIMQALTEPLWGVVERHGGERMQEQGASFLSDGDGGGRAAIRARGVYLVTARAHPGGGAGYFALIGAERRELSTSDGVHRVLVLPVG